jgi:hypothetical protein
MDLIARELKAMGVCFARSLSYAGVEFEILEHQLTPAQIINFDAWSDAWSVIHQNLETTLAAARSRLQSAIHGAIRVGDAATAVSGRTNRNGAGGRINIVVTPPGKRYNTVPTLEKNDANRY